MNNGTAKKIRISSQPPESVLGPRPPPRLKSQPTRHDSDMDYLSRRDEAEGALAQEVDRYLKTGRTMRDLIHALSMDYEFLDRDRFVNELFERIDKFPESRSKIGFVVSIFGIYEFTGHQDLAVECADFCISNSQGNHGMASAFSNLLCRVADNFVNNGGGQETCREVVVKTMRLSANRIEPSASTGSGAFSILRAISEASTFCRRIRISKEDDSQPGIVLAHLPLRGNDVFTTFLSAFENVCSYGKERPEAINEFIFSCMDMCKACRAELFVSAISILAWSSNLSKKENEKYVHETFTALQGWDQEYLECLEIGLLGAMKPPKTR